MAKGQWPGYSPADISLLERIDSGENLLQKRRTESRVTKRHDTGAEGRR
jgi:hypothetical protein